MKKILCIVAAALVIVLLVIYLTIPSAGKDVREEGRTAIREAVIHSAVQCYAVEGVYPPSLQYMEEKYGLRVNHDDYIIFYDVFASNQLPNVQVLVRGEG